MNWGEETKGRDMFAKLNHLAITSDIYASNARFYMALFGMKGSSNTRPARAMPVGDGRIGLNNIPRREGRRSGLDHFGFEVDSLWSGSKLSTLPCNGWFAPPSARMQPSARMILI